VNRLRDAPQSLIQKAANETVRHIERRHARIHVLGSSA
jgi:hypothetical protein